MIAGHPGSPSPGFFPDWRDIPIPVIQRPADARSYHEVAVDLKNPLFNEPILEASSLGIAGESYYARRDGWNVPYCRALEGALPKLWVRKSVGERLSQVNAALKPYGVELYGYDFLRTLRTQTEIWNWFVALARRTLPNPSEEAVIAFAGTYSSDPRGFDPKNERTWFTHSTGGAVDLTLRRIGGELLFMGAIFDEPSELSRGDYFERRLKSKGSLSQSEEAALRARRLLFHAMRSQGFAPYLAEFWHWDYGTQLAIANLKIIGAPHPEKAVYGPAPLPT